MTPPWVRHRDQQEVWGAMGHFMDPTWRGPKFFQTGNILTGCLAFELSRPEGEVERREMAIMCVLESAVFKILAC